MIKQHIRNNDNQEIVVYTLPVGQLQTNCYIVALGEIGYIIDPGDEGDYIATTVQRLHITPQAILLTHGHFDHVLAAFEVGMAFGIGTYLKKEDLFLIERMQKTAEHFLGYEVHDIPPKPLLFYEDSQVSGQMIQIVFTPGHTPGSVSLQIVGFPVVFTGDTLFAGGLVGDTNHSYSSTSELQKSVAMLRALDEKTIVFPGHGESTTLYEIGHV
ncbi:MAG: MBL fold metallo-hydrolase [Microgenomates group bacterium]